MVTHRFRPKLLLFCQQRQLREAAILCSILSPGIPPFVLVLDPPAFANHEYQELEQQYSASIKRGNELSVLTSQKGLTTPRRKYLAEKFARNLVRRRDLLLQMHPYTSWVYRLKRYEQIVESLEGFEFVACLFKPDEDYIDGILEMEKLWKSDKVRRYLESSETMFFVEQPAATAAIESASTDEVAPNIRRYSSLLDLYSQAREVAQINANYPLLEVPEDDHHAFLIGVARSLQAHVAIKPVAGSATAIEGEDIVGDAESNEAVLVEDTGQAEMLYAVIYAHSIGAKLIITKCPRREDFVNAIVAYEGGEAERQKNARRIHRSVWHFKDLSQLTPELRGVFEESQLYLRDNFKPADTKRFDFNSGIEALQRFLSRSSRRALISKLEAIAKREVQSQVVDGVGSRTLTVFTQGFPYNFVSDWYSKPIAHVIPDWGRIVYQELCDFADPTTYTKPYRLSVLYDPGYFMDSPESVDVLKILDDADVPVFVADRALASWSVIQILAKNFPIELIHLNTHGDWNATVFERFLPMTSLELKRWFDFTSAPIIFNNSCRSWLHVAEAFMASGARGYIGTIWSIPIRTAAIAARDIVNRLVNEGLTVAQSLAVNDPDSRERNYIFIGTASARLMEQPPDDRAHRKLWLPAFGLAFVLKELAEHAPEHELGNSVVHATFEAAESAYQRLASREDKTTSASDLLIVRGLMMQALRSIVLKRGLLPSELSRYLASGTKLIDDLKQLAPLALDQPEIEEFLAKFANEQEWNGFTAVHTQKEG